jgi:hypothetical protein
MKKITLIFVTTLFMCGAAAIVGGCGDDSGGGSQGSAGAGASGGGATVTSASSGAGQGGAGGAGQGGAGGGSACHGDDAAWAAATAEPLACEVNSDCCVVFNGCISAAQVVTSDKVSAAKAAWPYCDNDCNDCIPPAVVVECSADKKCVGYRVPEDENPPPELSQDHCGKNEPPLMMMNPAIDFSCGG